MKHLMGLLFSILTLCSGSVEATCYGRITNPVTDVCWECVFPIIVGQNTSLISGSGFPNVTTDADSMCSCVANGSVTFGMNLGFWEPIRTIEIVREPFCFPSLGGITMGGRFSAPAHGRTPKPKDRGHRTSFYQVHWYHTPWLYLLEVIFDTKCLEASPWDVAYMTELDPLWDDSMSSFLLNPDVT